jgi:hypothetical protein
MYQNSTKSVVASVKVFNQVTKLPDTKKFVKYVCFSPLTNIITDVPLSGVAAKVKLV